jgi:hypothetical protein
MCGINLDLVTEDCVICKYDTGYDGYDKIKDRKYYVKGRGQLCGWCYKRRYRNKQESK